MLFLSTHMLHFRERICLIKMRYFQRIWGITLFFFIKNIVLDLIGISKYFYNYQSFKKCAFYRIQLNISGFSSCNRYGFILQIDCDFLSCYGLFVSIFWFYATHIFHFVNLDYSLDHYRHNVIN
jgi:hypothetical protein